MTAACFIILCLIVIYAANWAAVLARPFSIAYEGPIAWVCRHLSQGQNIYPASGLQHQPWIVTIYPPVFITIGAILLKLFGGLFVPLRAISMTATTLAAISMYRLLRLYQCTTATCLCALIFFFGTVTVATNSFMARTDMLAIALGILLIERFVSVYQNIPKNNTSLRPYLPLLVLALLALFTKQQAAVFIIAIPVFLLLVGSIQLAGKLILLFCLAMFALVALLQTLTGGGFISHLFFLAPVRSQTTILIANIRALSLDNYKLLLAFALAPLGILKMKKISGLNSLPLILILISLSTMLVSMGIPAASENHAIASIFAITWWLALSLQRLPIACTAIVLIMSTITFPKITEYALVEPKLLPYAQRSATILQARMLANKPVLTDDPNINLLTDSKPVMIDCATFINVWQARGDKIDEDNLVRSLNQQNYAAVLINQADLNAPGTAWWPTAIVTTVKKNYRPIEAVACSGWLLDLLEPTDKNSAADTHAATDKYSKQPK